ncbi:MAG: radical SAM protein [Deltaproteobacteria bacterium]|jgi:MoaA/NifB/PqqE/SkfB family radical SAM enzyme|nr:radical SAM protein [Deltaproteobacteria bacterium]
MADPAAQTPRVAQGERLTVHARAFSHVTAQALVPEQLVSYVAAVSQSHPVLCDGCVAYDYEGQRTLIAYVLGALPDEDAEAAEAAMNAAVKAALAGGGCSALTVLGPARPAAAPPDAAIREDAYAFLALPVEKMGQNLRNMLRRGGRECTVAEEQWNNEHAALVRACRDFRQLEAGTRHIYGRIPEYLAASPEAALFAARDASSRLLALAVGDFSSLSTAFYMFAFRRSDCPPGAADVLLHAIVGRAADLGHQHLNLGLGVNKGIAAFKGKWGACLRLPCIQTSWTSSVRRRPAAPRTRAKDADPLAVFTPPGFSGTVRRFLFGETRPFDCLQIEVSSRCPGTCVYCPHTTKQDVWRSRYMEDATFAALAPLIHRTKRVHLQGWGEPLLHPRFFEYAAAAVRIGSAVSTTTCGVAVNDDSAARFVDSGIDIAAFSLTGVDGASNAARAVIPFARVRDGILALNRAKRLAGSEYPRVHLAYLMLASEAENVVRLPDLMRSLDVPAAVVSTLDYIAAPGMEAEAYAPHEAEKIGRARILLHEAAERAASAGRTIHYSLPGEHGGNDCSERVQSCMYIDAEGAVAPCIYVNLPTDESDPFRRAFGSVRERNPLDIWNEPEYARFRARLASGDPDVPCVACAKRFERIS